uniref:Uncharacterized protein n=1 Tax=Pyxicephalus adspersus TaxID=30357 RepID=A0AAV3B5W0_PYXAD|nr:TPA: hypothetical protein GDO54_000758 [Pyxicephalus adspersus]
MAWIGTNQRTEGIFIICMYPYIRHAVHILTFGKFLRLRFIVPMFLHQLKCIPFQALTTVKPTSSRAFIVSQLYYLSLTTILATV